MQNCLTDEPAAIIIHAFITNKLKYCNSLLYFQIWRLQKIALCILTKFILTKFKRDRHMTPILKHCFPVLFFQRDDCFKESFSRVVFHELTWSNNNLSWRSDSPTHLLKQSAPFLIKNATLWSPVLHSLAKARATRVLPVPWNE